MGEHDMEDTSLIEPVAAAMDIGKRAVEATLFASERPMTIADIRAYVGDELDIRQILADLQEDFRDRGIVLIRTGDRWHFQTARDLSHLLRRERAELRKSALASSFLATLELARQGKLELQQEGSFAPLRIKATTHG